MKSILNSLSVVLVLFCALPAIATNINFNPKVNEYKKQNIQYVYTESGLRLYSQPPEDPANPSHPTQPGLATCGYGDGCEWLIPGEACTSRFVRNYGVCVQISSGPNSNGQVACECVNR